MYFCLTVATAVCANKCYSTNKVPQHVLYMVQRSRRRLRHVLDTSDVETNILTGKVVCVSGLPVHEYS